MSFASRHQREVGNFKTKGELYDTYGEDFIFRIVSLSIVNNQFGNTVPVIDFAGTDEDGNPCTFKVSLSEDMVANVQEILDDSDALNQIAEGHAGFKIYMYRNPNQKNKRCHGVTWVDIDDDGNEIPFK